MDVEKSMIVTAEMAPLARALAVGVAPNSGQGMFTTELSPTGNAPATHYISAGWIDEDIANALGSAETLHGAAVAAGYGEQITFEQCEALVASSDVADGSGQNAMDRLGLQLVRAEDI